MNVITTAMNGIGRITRPFQAVSILPITLIIRYIGKLSDENIRLDGTEIYIYEDLDERAAGKMEILVPVCNIFIWVFLLQLVDTVFTGFSVAGVSYPWFVSTGVTVFVGLIVIASVLMINSYHLEVVDDSGERGSR